MAKVNKPDTADRYFLDIGTAGADPDVVSMMLELREVMRSQQWLDIWRFFHEHGTKALLPLGFRLEFRSRTHGIEVVLSCQHQVLKATIRHQGQVTGSGQMMFSPTRDSSCRWFRCQFMDCAVSGETFARYIALVLAQIEPGSEMAAAL